MLKIIADENIKIDSRILEFPLEFLKNIKANFAFIYKENDEIICARSLFSANSIYYFFDGKNFEASLDKKELLSRHKKELDLSALSEYLSFMSAKKSFFKNIFELKNGEFLRYKNGVLKKEFFDSLLGIPVLDCADLESRILDILNEQISKNLAFNPCALLSGGLDSSLLCALFARLKNEKIQTFNIAFLDEPHYDESAFAKTSAKFIGAKYESLNLSKNDFLDIFYHLNDFCDEPLADSATIALRFLSQKIAEFGYKTAFSAEGADECFLGYDLYFRVLEFYENNIPSAKYPQISKDSEYLRRKALGLPIYGAFCEVFTHYQKELLLGNSSFDECILPYQNDYKDLCQMRYMDLSIATQGMVFKKLNYMSDLLSIKTPFLALAKLALSIENPSPNGIPKELLKNIAKKQKLLPDEIIYRKKKGLSTPFLEWILKEMDVSKEILKANEILKFPLFSEVFVRELERKAKRGRFKQHLWSLLCFARWLEHHFN